MLKFYQELESLWPVWAVNTLKAGAIAGRMIIGRVYAPGMQVLTGYIGRDKITAVMPRHIPMCPLLYQAHNDIGIVDRHVLVIDLRFTAAQEIGQVNGYKAHMGHALGKLICQKLGHIDLFAMAIGVGWTNLWYGYAQVSALRKHHGRIALRVAPV